MNLENLDRSIFGQGQLMCQSVCCLNGIRVYSFLVEQDATIFARAGENIYEIIATLMDTQRKLETDFHDQCVFFEVSVQFNVSEEVDEFLVR